VAAAALRRTESRGGHYRSDFPLAGPALRTFITLADVAPEPPIIRHQASASL
ncbi:MAG: hypothetical protein JOZ55_01165, partial [Alphaproteobacteria bacterium]|nr:hypothetical protein [Alphaproteobacteria bacterium]